MKYFSQVLSLSLFYKFINNHLFLWFLMYKFTYLFWIAYLFTHSFVYQFIYSCTDLLIYLFMHRFIYLFINLFIYLFIYTYIYLLTYLFIYLFIHIFICSISQLVIYHFFRCCLPRYLFSKPYIIENNVKHLYSRMLFFMIFYNTNIIFIIAPITYKIVLHRHKLFYSLLISTI